MMNQAQWAMVSVGDFFRGYNWRGAAPVLESSVSEASLSDLPSLLCLSVTDFFAQGNWHGQRQSLETAIPDLQRPSYPPQALSITASVRDFCRGINWQGTGMAKAPVVATPVAKPSDPPIAKAGPNIGLSDLSELF
ncbi:MAG: hypothetical protein VKL20_08650 [Synechocystis sp.]|nr:hypothetical protein [Synechocystis sp.]